MVSRRAINDKTNLLEGKTFLFFSVIRLSLIAPANECLIISKTYVKRIRLVIADGLYRRKAFL